MLLVAEGSGYDAYWKDDEKVSDDTTDVKQQEGRYLEDSLM